MLSNGATRTNICFRLGEKILLCWNINLFHWYRNFRSLFTNYLFFSHNFFSFFLKRQISIFTALLWSTDMGFCFYLIICRLISYLFYFSPKDSKKDSIPIFCQIFNYIYMFTEISFIILVCLPRSHKIITDSI